jgi:hypothetical protein
VGLYIPLCIFLAVGGLWGEESERKEQTERGRRVKRE